MKKLVFAALLATVALGATFADAQQRRYSASNPPPDLWCRDAGDSGGSWTICSAYTFQQCMASRYSHTETCYLNPLYDPRFRR